MPISPDHQRPTMTKRKVRWGAQLKVGPNPQTGDFVGDFTMDGGRAISNNIQVGIFTSSPTDWANLTLGIVVGIPIRTNGPLTYLSASGLPKDLHLIKILFPNGHFSVTTFKHDNTSFLIKITPGEIELGDWPVLGQSWPIQPRTENGRQFVEGSA